MWRIVGRTVAFKDFNSLEVDICVLKNRDVLTEKYYRSITGTLRELAEPARKISKQKMPKRKQNTPTVNDVKKNKQTKMPKRKRNTPAVNVIVNLLNFFAPEAPEVRFEAVNKPATPDSLFPKHEVIVRAQGAIGLYIAAESKRDGTLMGKCRNCTRDKKSIEAFAPPDNLQNCRRRPAFFAAVDEYERAYAARDLEAARAARDKVVELRHGFCPPCQEVHNKLTPKVEACRTEWVRMRKEAGVCATPGCRENGPDAWEVLQANHLDPTTKVHILGDYTWWAKGEWTVEQCVAEMRKEAAKCNFLCGFCHKLDEHSTSGNRNGDPATMPPGKQGKTASKDEIDQYKARHSAKICFPKQQFVDAEKLRRGCCANPACRRLVTPETCPAFPFDHRDESTKLIGKDTLAGERPGGVGGLVHNKVKAAALDKIRPILAAEMHKCRLLCENCHHRKTRYGLVINTEDEVQI
jgi:hypothetical protein